MKAKYKEDYMEYTRKTGKCMTCHKPIKGHPRCQACGIFCNANHGNTVSYFRRHQVCESCVEGWKRKEELIGRRIGWGNFLRELIFNMDYEFLGFGKKMSHSGGDYDKD